MATQEERERLKEEFEAALQLVRLMKDPEYLAEIDAAEAARRRWSGLPSTRAADGTAAWRMTEEQSFQADAAEGRR
jgi:hypothetical protein